MTRPCSDGCGKLVRHYREECYPVAPWDPTDLPPCTLSERCNRHLPTKGRSAEGQIPLCAYRDDDPARCSNCHRFKVIGCRCAS
jgi:hypothetical protein